MFIIHRVLISLRRIGMLCYYKVIYGKKFKYGNHFRFRANFHLYIQDEGYVHLGNNVFLNNNFSATSIKSIQIGDDCIFGENVKIYDHNHNYKSYKKPIWKQGLNSRGVVIGNNCWIASNVTILAGVHIGDNCIIGANTLIYKDVPSDSIVKHREEMIIANRRNEDVS